MLTLKNIDVKNKKVILRVDYNVPIKDGKILDTNKIVASLDTINYLLDNNAKIIIMSHLGKVKTEEDIETNTLLPVKEVLSKLLNKEILFSKELEGKEKYCIVSKFGSHEQAKYYDDETKDLYGDATITFVIDEFYCSYNNGVEEFQRIFDIQPE